MNPLYLALAALFGPLLVAVLLGVVSPLRHTGKPAAWLSVFAAVVSAVLSVVLLIEQLSMGGALVDSQVSWLPVGGQSLVNLGVHIDGISAPMLVVVTVVALCVQVYSLGYMADEDGPGLGRYFTYHSLFIFSMAALVVAPNALQLFLGWELVGLASYLLIGFYWTKPSAAQAALKAFWVTKFADMGLLIGLIVLYTTSGTFGWDAATVTALGTTGATWVAGMFFVAVVGKSAQFPLHIWLPDAMEGPTPVSALLHAATMVAAGVFLIVRAFPIFEAAPDILTIMAWLGSFTALFAASIAMIQTDIKKVLAYSTCSQLGYMVAALGTGAMMGGFFHLVTHAFFKALLFLVAGSFIHAVHSNDVKDMGGLWSKMKPSSVLFIIGSAALAGIPGLAGFFSKDVILEEVYESDRLVLWAVLLLTAGMTAFYMTRIVMLALFGARSEKAEHAHESPLVMLAPMALLAVGAIGVGYGGGTIAEMAGIEAYQFHMSMTGYIATGLGLGGIGLGVWAYSPARRSTGVFSAMAPAVRFIRASAVDETARWLYEQFLLGLANTAGWVDRYIIDGLMNFVAWATIMAGRGLRRGQTGVVSDYVYAVIVGLIMIVVVKAVIG